jgi:AraC-like DNA-binding protein
MKQLKHELAENLQYDSPDFPLRAMQGRLQDYPSSVMPPHWHNELEFILLRSGSAVYRVNERDYRLTAGDALFVNSNRLHFGYSAGGEDFAYSVLHFLPELVSDHVVRRKYLMPLTSSTACDAVLFRAEGGGETEIYATIRTLISLYLQPPQAYELNVLEHVYHLLRLLEGQSDIRQHIDDDAVAARVRSMQTMLKYVQQHYAERITLDDIAAAGTMCRSKCTFLFRQVLQQTAIEYVQSVRLQKSCDLLTETDLSMTEIASRCGFSGASYFVELFHQQFGITPRRYRAMLRSRSTNIT